MHESAQVGPGRAGDRAGWGRTRRGRRTVAFAVAVVLPLAATGPAAAVTGVTVVNTVKLTGRGPVDTTNGFPVWYGDSRGNRLGLCLDDTNPFCGFLNGDVPNPDAPLEFPGNFPDELFYFLGGAELDLPGGGRAVLTTALEAAFTNAVQNGDQMVFGRVRIVVRGAPPDTTLTFRHPYGSAQIDTDATGSGRLVEDVGASAGAFDAALKSNVGPFLVATGGPVTGPDGGTYVGNPDVPTTVTGGLDGYNRFSVTGGGLDVTTDQFTLMGKLATNRGVQADAAVPSSGFLDVWATSASGAVEVVGGQGYATTGMQTDPGSGRWYARVKLTGPAPGSVRVRSLTDAPASTSDVAVASRAVRVDQAEYDGTTLTVRATSVDGGTIALEGFGDVTSGQAEQIAVTAPPAVVTARQGSSTASRPVDITGGTETVPLPPVPPSGTVDPTPGGDTSTSTGGTVTPGGSTGTGGTTGPAAPVARVAAAAVTAVRGASTVLDASTSTGAASYRWTQVSGPAVTVTGETTAKPTVVVPLLTTGQGPTPLTVANGPSVLRVTVTGTAAAGQTAPTATADVTLTPDVEQLTVTAARHRIGNELRIDATALYAGQPRVLQPPTQVAFWDVSNPATPVRLGTAAVDSLGTTSLRLRPGPGRQVTSVLLQTSRGGAATTPVAAR